MKFEVLFDEGEPSSLSDPAFAPYGKLGFPKPPKDRPWTFANFVQSIDGVASFGGKHATGGDLAQSQEDQWLMGLLRAHADAILLGLNTLIAETAILTQINAGRGPVYKIEYPELRELRRRLRRQLIHRHQGEFSHVNPGAMKVVGRSRGGFLLSQSAASCSGGIRSPISLGATVTNFSSIKPAFAMLPYNVGPPSQSKYSTPRSRCSICTASSKSTDRSFPATMTCAFVPASRPAPVAVVRTKASTSSLSRRR